MSGFVSLPPAGPGAPPAADDAVAFDGWYPALSLAACKSAMRISSDITDYRLREAMLNAMLTAALDLHDWQVALIAGGFATLPAVSNAEVGGENRLAVLWRKAVYHLTAADIDELQRAPDTRNLGADRADVLDPVAADHRRNAKWALRDMMGQSRSTIELI